MRKLKTQIIIGGCGWDVVTFDVCACVEVGILNQNIVSVVVW